MFRVLPQARVFTRSFGKATIQRSHHTATAQLITMSPQGTPITRQIDVWLGDRGSAYVYFDPEFSQPFQADRALQGDGSTPQDPELIPLEFHHDTRHFAHKSSSYPRLEIPQNPVGRAGATQGNSPATLHLWGMANAITLDGTADSGFQHCL